VGGGENFLLLNVSQTATRVTGRYVSQMCPNAQWWIFTAMRLEFITNQITLLVLNKGTEIFEQFDKPLFV